MFELMKIVGVSAVLSAGFVTASEIPGQPDREPSAKIYTDRVPEGDAVPSRALRITYVAATLEEGAQASSEAKGDMLRNAPQRCASQAWPNIPAECIGAPDGTSPRGNVRMITVEQREGANTSVLVRVPVSEVAQR
jgi:hypothetical protein